MAGEDDLSLTTGLNILIVDDNPTCLKILERLLLQCDYIVTITTESLRALQILRENKGKYDMVISDVHLPKMNGLQLLQHVGFELDIPVIMLSANDDPRLVMKGIQHGAVDYLLKPVRMEEIKNIWQHIVRRNHFGRRRGSARMNDFEGEQNLREATGSVLPSDGITKKRKDKDTLGDDVGDGEDDERGSESTDLASQKKARVVWSPDLHKKFVTAVQQLGVDKAFPKKILDHMNVDGLTRENVASHLQKYRLYLRRMSMDPTTMPFESYGLPSSPLYLSGPPSMYNPYTGRLGHYPGPGGYCSILSQSASNVVSNFAQSVNVGHLPNQMAPLGMSPYGFQSRPLLLNQALMVAPPPALMPQGGTPQLADYSRRLEMWQNARQATPQSDNPITFNGAEMSYLQSAFEYTSLGPPTAPINVQNGPVLGGQEAQLGAQNGAFNAPVELPRWPDQLLDGADPLNAFNNMTLAPVIAPSSRVFGVESPPRAINPLPDFQDSDIEQYLIDAPDLQLDFDDNNGGTLEDIVKGLPQ